MSKHRRTKGQKKKKTSEGRSKSKRRKNRNRERKALASQHTSTYFASKYTNPLDSPPLNNISEKKHKRTNTDEEEEKTEDRNQ
jgi:hypothetical protein